MRKLSKVEKDETNSLDKITNNCSCRVICGKEGYKNSEDLQAEYAYTGTMPQQLDR